MTPRQSPLPVMPSELELSENEVVKEGPPEVPGLGERMLIVTGDDFGASSEINHAIIGAHRHGILTSASLMVNGPSFEEGVEMAQSEPNLAVGLHLALSLSRATLPPQQIPALVNSEGHFSRSPGRAGCKYFFCRSVLSQLEREIRAQIEKFLSTGLSMDHVDGHQHLHLHPTVLPILVQVCEEYRIPTLRVVRDDLALNLRISRDRLVPKLALSLTFSFLAATAQRILSSSPLRTADRVLGLLQDGNMATEHLYKLLPSLPSGVTEIYSHPSLGQRSGTSTGSRLEYEALVDPGLRIALERLGIRRTCYRALPPPKVTIQRGRRKEVIKWPF